MLTVGLHSIFHWTQLLASTLPGALEATHQADCQDPAITDTDYKCVHVTLCFLIRSLRLVNQPWHLPHLDSSYWEKPWREARCHFSLDDLITVLKKTSESTKQTTPPLSPKPRLLFSGVGPSTFTDTSCCYGLQIRKKALSLNFMGEIVSLNTANFLIMCKYQTNF